MASDKLQGKVARFGWGLYPQGYNPRVHGPYNPGRYYGKPDAALQDVKLGELFQWMSRRSFRPMAGVSAVSRFWWRWAQKWLIVQKPTMVPITQLMIMLSIFHCVNTRNPAHNKHKYHW